LTRRVPVPVAVPVASSSTAPVSGGGTTAPVFTDTPRALLARHPTPHTAVVIARALDLVVRVTLAPRAPARARETLAPRATVDVDIPRVTVDVGTVDVDVGTVGTITPSRARFSAAGRVGVDLVGANERPPRARDSSPRRAPPTTMRVATTTRAMRPTVTPARDRAPTPAPTTGGRFVVARGTRARDARARDAPVGDGDARDRARRSRSGDAGARGGRGGARDARRETRDARRARSFVRSFVAPPSVVSERTIDDD
jgi:hypothetical protein